MLFVGGTLWVVRTKSDLGGLTAALNVLAGALVLLNLVPIVAHAFERKAPAPPPAAQLELPDASTIPESSKRDIYYIIFDRYANERTLRTFFHYDNSEILGYLEGKGFYVAHDSAANHQKTAHSVASSLNMSYLNYLSDSYPETYEEFHPIYQLLRNFQASKLLKSIGYRYYHIGSWWNPTQEDPSADVNYVYGALSEFSQLLLKTTLWGPVSEEFGFGESLGFRPTEARRVQYQFQKLATVKNDPHPTFTFMHMLLPHPPTVFDEDGNLVMPDQEKLHGDKENYVNQLIYTNERMKEMIDDLLAGPDDEDPIIIIQSDEGPHPPRLQKDENNFNWFTATRSELREKLLVLNAYYLPGVSHKELYQTISPVNSFRLLFDLYFGADLPLLPDRTYVYKDRFHLFDFREVPDAELGIDRESHNLTLNCSSSCLRNGGVPPP
jgi:hypothetical protein